MPTFARLLLTLSVLTACTGAADKPPDTGDTGDTADTSDTNETGDTGDTSGHTADTSGDSGDTSSDTSDTSADPCPVARLSAESLTWTDLTLGAPATEALTVQNDCEGGSTTLTVGASVDNASFTVAVDTSSIAPGATATVSVTATVFDHLAAGGILSLATNDPDHPLLTVVLSAVAAADQDGDGHDALDAGGDDCDDADPTVYPDAIERCDEAQRDEDCDGVADDADDSTDETSKVLYYGDADGDHFGDADASTLACTLPAGTVENAEDCDDTSAAIFPGAAETVNDGADQDCDGVDACYTDADGDDYGTTVVVAGSTLDCTTGTGAPVSTDCDDRRATVHPDAPETVNNGIDEDCDAVDACYTDADGDNYGTTVVVDGSALNCTAGTGAPVATDCDDADSGVYPGALEVCSDGVDDDCDGADDAICSLASAIAEYIGEAADDYAGDGVSGAGDVNADGFDDLLIGGFHNDDGGSNAGAAYLILGAEG